MATELYANVATTTVSAGGTTAPAGGTSEAWTVASSTPFPAAATGTSQFHVADPAAPTEIMTVTNVSGTTWTVTRGAESTTPVAHTAGFTVWLVVTSADLTAMATTVSVTAAVAVETSRAEAAEALLAPLASPALSGTPTAPTKTALTNNTDIATTAYADAAVAVELARAEAAEALALPLTGGTMSGAIAMGSHKVTGLANGSGAQDAAAYGQTPVGGTTVTVGQGGTGQTSANAGFNALSPMTTLGDSVYGGASGAGTRLAGDTSNTRKFLRTQSSGGTAAAPAWDTIQSGDVPTLNQNTSGTASNITDTLDQVPHAAASVNLNSQKITSLANGSSAQDAAAFGQLPSAGTPLPLNQGGTGTSAGSANAAYNALSPMTTLGDIEYENSTPAAARLAGNTTTQKQYLSQTGNGSVSAAPAWSYVPGQYLCAPAIYAPSSQVQLAAATTTLAAPNVAATTVAAGSNGGVIDNIAAWSSPSAGVLDVATTTGWPASGTVNVAASGSTTAVVNYTGTAAGQLTGCTYVSGAGSGQTVATGGAVTLTSVTLQTGSFTAPASGNVLVTVHGIMQQSVGSDTVMLALAAAGTVTPVIGYTTTPGLIATTTVQSVTALFYVSGLTPGNSYQLALLAAAQSGTTMTIYAQGLTSTSIGNKGGPVVMTVQAV